MAAPSVFDASNIRHHARLPGNVIRVRRHRQASIGQRRQYGARLGILARHRRLEQVELTQRTALLVQMDEARRLVGKVGVFNHDAGQLHYVAAQFRRLEAMLAVDHEQFARGAPRHHERLAQIPIPELRDLADQRLARTRGEVALIFVVNLQFGRRDEL